MLSTTSHRFVQTIHTCMDLSLICTSVDPHKVLTLVSFCAPNITFNKARQSEHSGYSHRHFLICFDAGLAHFIAVVPSW